MYKFSVNDIVGINGDEYRVVRVLPHGLLARWARCADHSQVLSSKDIEIARMSGVLSVRREFDRSEGTVDSSAHTTPSEKVARRRKKTPSVKQS